MRHNAIGMPSWTPMSEWISDSLTPDVASTRMARRQHQSMNPAIPHSGSRPKSIRLISRLRTSSITAPDWMFVRTTAISRTSLTRADLAGIVALYRPEGETDEHDDH